MADFDNDGWKEMHITNGLEKDVTNNDYVSFRSKRMEAGYSFTGMDSKGKRNKETIALLRKHF